MSRIKSLALVLALLWAVPAQAATISLVAKVSATSGANSVTTGTITTSTAVLLVAHCGAFNGVPVISDSKSNMWTALADISDTGLHSAVAYVEAPVVGTLHTFTCTASTGGPVIHVFAFTVDTGTIVYDSQTVADHNPSAVSLQVSSAITPSAANSVLVSGITLWQHVSSLAINESYTPSDGDWIDADADSVTDAAAYLIQTSATASQPNWTWTGTAIAVTRLAAFKPSAGGVGGGSSGCRLTLLGVGGACSE